MENIGTLISKRRKQMGLTRYELAEATYTSEDCVNKWEQGKEIPDLEQIYSLVRILKINLSELVGTDEEVSVERVMRLFLEIAEAKKRRQKRYCWGALFSSWIAFVVNECFVGYLEYRLVDWLGTFFLILTIVFISIVLKKLN